MIKSQEPKYDCVNGKLVNRATHEAIPDDEPVFVFRAKDIHSVSVLYFYIGFFFRDSVHRRKIQERVIAFEKFQRENPEKVGEPDTTETVDPLDTGFND